jgi:hypothetical protein
MKISGARAFRRVGSLGVACLAVLLSCTQEERTQPANDNIVFPEDAGVIDVTQPPYGAVGDGVADDTAAIQKAITDNTGIQFGTRTLYLPDGTYRVSDTLIWVRRLTLQGQSTGGVVIRLADDAPGFDDPSDPKAVLFPGGSFLPDGTLEAFANNVFNLTVDTGSGNPGAIGIGYLGHNQGSIRDVTVRSGDGQGRAGLAMLWQWPGPSLVKNLRVEGFDYGIDLAQTQTAVTLEHVSLVGFRSAGIRNDDLILAIRDLATDGGGPAILNSGDRGLITLLDGHFTGDGGAANAVENHGFLYLRNVETSEYGEVLAGQGSFAVEYVSHPLLRLSSVSAGSLGLPVEETPEVRWDENFADWANVQDFGADPSDTRDDTAAIQAAIDSGKSVIYFPSDLPSANADRASRMYLLNSTVVVRGNVKRLVGLQSTIRVDEGFRGTQEPVFRFETTTADRVVFDGFFGFMWPFGQEPFWLEHVSSKPLVIRNTILGHGLKAYRSAAGTGKVFIEDVTGGGWRFVSGQRVWARQFNTEYLDDEPMTVNAGGVLWILGIKTERANTVLRTTQGGSTEVLGGFVSPVPDGAADSAIPAFVNDESSFSASYGTRHYCNPDHFEVHVEETRGRVTGVLRRTDLYTKGTATCGKAAPLYVGH